MIHGFICFIFCRSCLVLLSLFVLPFSVDATAGPHREVCHVFAFLQKCLSEVYQAYILKDSRVRSSNNLK